MHISQKTVFQIYEYVAYLYYLFKSEVDILREESRALRNNSVILGEEANTIRNNPKYLEKRSTMLLKSLKSLEIIQKY